MKLRAACLRLLGIIAFVTGLGLWPGASAPAMAMTQHHAMQASAAPDCPAAQDDPCRQHCLGQTLISDAFVPQGPVWRVVPFAPAPAPAIARSSQPEPEGKPPRI